MICIRRSGPLQEGWGINPGTRSQPSSQVGLSGLLGGLELIEFSEECLVIDVVSPIARERHVNHPVNLNRVAAVGEW